MHMNIYSEVSASNLKYIRKIKSRSIFSNQNKPEVITRWKSVY